MTAYRFGYGFRTMSETLQDWRMGRREDICKLCFPVLAGGERMHILRAVKAGWCTLVSHALNIGRENRFKLKDRCLR